MDIERKNVESGSYKLQTKAVIGIALITITSSIIIDSIDNAGGIKAIARKLYSSAPGCLTLATMADTAFTETGDFATGIEFLSVATAGVIEEKLDRSVIDSEGRYNRSPLCLIMVPEITANNGIIENFSEERFTTIKDSLREDAIDGDGYSMNLYRLEGEGLPGDILMAITRIDDMPITLARQKTFYSEADFTESMISVRAGDSTARAVIEGEVGSEYEPYSARTDYMVASVDNREFVLEHGGPDLPDKDSAFMTYYRAKLGGGDNTGGIIDAFSQQSALQEALAIRYSFEENLGGAEQKRTPITLMGEVEGELYIIQLDPYVFVNENYSKLVADLLRDIGINEIITHDPDIYPANANDFLIDFLIETMSSEELREYLKEATYKGALTDEEIESILRGEEKLSHILLSKVYSFEPYLFVNMPNAAKLILKELHLEELDAESRLDAERIAAAVDSNIGILKRVGAYNDETISKITRLIKDFANGDRGNQTMRTLRDGEFTVGIQEIFDIETNDVSLYYLDTDYSYFSSYDILGDYEKSKSLDNTNVTIGDVVIFIDLNSGESALGDGSISRMVTPGSNIALLVIPREERETPLQITLFGSNL